MRTTEQTLLEKLKITRYEIRRRQEFFNLTEKTRQSLISLREAVEENLDEIVEEFYANILRFSEMDRLIGDAETLRRLKNHQRNYILSLFDGQYDEEYVHSRLRVGMVHNRIGVEPKYYISALNFLLASLRSLLSTQANKDCHSCSHAMTAVEKIIMFDLSFVIDTYVNSLTDEVRRSKEEMEKYAESLEEVISERTKRLKEQARHDGLTSLLNQRSFYDELRRELLRGQRRNHPISLIYFDLDGFKKLNDSEGHKRGDEILVAVADAMRKSLRESETKARYGGDEFCVILPDCSEQEASQVCKRLCAAIEAAVAGCSVTCSMGIATTRPENQLDANTLVKLADQAMYEAKKEKGFSVRTSSKRIA